MSELNGLRARWKGLWQNRKGSLLRIFEVEAIQEEASRTHFRIQGQYQTAVGRPSPEVRFPVSGFVTGDQVVFSVSFRVSDAKREEDEPKDSMTAWAGQILPEAENSGKQILQTLWHLTRNVTEEEDSEGSNPEEKQGWASLLAGADFFEKISDDPEDNPPTTE